VKFGVNQKLESLANQKLVKFGVNQKRESLAQIENL
jgi:hypothetical protein